MPWPDSALWISVKRKWWSCGSSAGSRWRKSPRCWRYPGPRSSGNGASPGPGSTTRSKADKRRMGDACWERLNEIFHAALELPLDQRAGFLDYACSHDPGLRAEVERLMVAHERAEPLHG